MRASLILLMMVAMAPAAFSQKMSKKHGSSFLPKVFPSLDNAQKDSMQRALLYWNWRKTQPSTPYVPQTEDMIPNGIREKVQEFIYRRNNGRGGRIYQSSLDNMLLVAPDSSAVYNMPNGSVQMAPIKP